MGRFLIKKAGSGYIFNLEASNGQVICTSQVYASEATCKNGIESVRKNCKSKIEDQTLQGFEALTNPKYEIYLDKAGEYRFRLKASNGENIAASQGYKSKQSCKSGIESVMNNAPDSAVEKQMD
ncbi:MAG: YegP family protein [Candidatus Methanomethylophilaceae archaeon]